MTSLKYIGYIVVAAASLFSCATSENTLDFTLGHIQVSVEVAAEISPDKDIALTISSEDGKYSHTWSDYKQFSNLEGYYAGVYHAKAVYGTEGTQGFDCPCYIGSEDFDVANNRLTNVNILCQLSQAMVQVKSTAAFASRFPDGCVQAHSAGFPYVEITQETESPAYVMPGLTDFAIILSSSDDNKIIVESGLEITTTADTSYIINLDYADGTVTAECEGHKSVIELTEDVMAATGPTVTCKGFVNGENVTLTEGFPSASKLIMEVVSPTKLRNLTLTTISDTPSLVSWTDECDLLTNADRLLDAGLSMTSIDATTTAIDFTVLLENLSVEDNSEITFMLQATDNIGRVSNVATLAASIHSVEIIELEISPAVIGENIATLTLVLNENNVETKDFSVYIDDGNTPAPTPMNIVEATDDNYTNRMTLSFELPDGIAPVPIRVDYMDKTKLYTKVERIVPQYSLNIDPFVTTIMVNVMADSPQITSAITRYAHILVNGKEIAILDRNIEEGSLYCAGFNAGTSYTVELEVIADQYVAKKQIKTEKAQQLPDGDFEDAEKIIEYKKFPSGGKYSSTAFAIYNQQNFDDVLVFWPKKGWASVNAKTFCTRAKNHNSWYMQPSAKIDYNYKVSGNKSISLSSVGWSHSGKEIEPYTQEPGDFLPYNPHTPPIDHISAGYLYLGEYHYNADTGTETYSQGISFGSRPSSLNGYFKYIPDLNTPSDCGWVKVEVVNVDSSGNETILATARMEFPNAPDFRSFNLPLHYDVFYKPATKVRVMFCTSTRTDGLSFDDPEVPVSVDVENSRFTGSTLWVDNLSFSY